MSGTAFTQAEWTVDGDALAMGNQIVVTARDFGPDGASAAEKQANIRLASTSPRLLASLQAMLDAMDDGSDEPTLITARAIVAEATGSAT